MGTLEDAPVPTKDGFVSEWERWHADRLAAVNADDGPPTLVATHWLDETDTVPGVPGTWADCDGEVVLTAPDGERTIALAAGQQAGTRLRLAGLTLQVTTRVGRRGIRVFDHARANAIGDIEAFEPSPEWVVEGRFRAAPEDASAGYSFALESAPRAVQVAGVLTFTLVGEDHETRPLSDEGDSLFLVFADATTGTATKPPARFLHIDAPDESGAVTLDFNRAYLPPCAFSDEFNCPLPPAGHRLAVAVTAGEAWARQA